MLKSVSNIYSSVDATQFELSAILFGLTYTGIAV